MEENKAAAKAFKENNPEATVFREDCRELLKEAKGVKKNFFSGQQIPAKGEVELLCGGPPCQVIELTNLKGLEISLQGFSEINRHKSGKNAQMKNSLVSTYLDYCDFYRPKFFILENVRKFASDDKAAVLKFCINRLLSMGYQCTFGILQVTQYSVCIKIYFEMIGRAVRSATGSSSLFSSGSKIRSEVTPDASSQTCLLPRGQFWKTRSFTTFFIIEHFVPNMIGQSKNILQGQALQLSVEIDGVRYGKEQVYEAPYRAVSVWESISDLSRCPDLCIQYFASSSPNLTLVNCSRLVSS